ncbi:MAG TPA: hypothetical protein VFH61_17735 [Thermoleophilia bacterium]|nr:hypothetical protein [Thermoleophilia bacterium]
MRTSWGRGFAGGSTFSGNDARDFVAAAPFAFFAVPVSRRSCRRLSSRT